MTVNRYQRRWEWEYVEFPLVLTEIQSPGGAFIFSPNTSLALHRNDDFQLTGTISGFTKKRLSLDNHPEEGPGNFITEQYLEAITPDRMFRYSLHGCVFKEISRKGIIYDDIGMPYTGEVTFQSLIMTPIYLPDDAQITAESQWFLSRKFEGHFPRSTHREGTQEYIRSREGIQQNQNHSKVQTSGDSCDHFQIDAAGIKCIVGVVPKELAPTWARGVVIEYTKSFGLIKSEEIMEAIVLLVGFLLGTELIYIGFTKYAKNSVIEATVHGPKMTGIRAYCEKACEYPIRLSMEYDWGKIEWLVNRLLPQYLATRQSLRLNDALWRYFQSRQHLIGVNLPVLASALEGLAERWLKTKNVQLHYLPKDEWLTIIAPEIESLQLKIARLPDSEQILNKLKGAWTRGGRQKMSLFFQSIDLPLSKIEKEAMDARNGMAHGGAVYETIEEAKELVLLTRAYETLFHRTVLSILGYEEYYIDHYMANRPLKKIQIPTGEK